MKTTLRFFLVAAALLSLQIVNLHAATRHVWPDSPAPGAPFDQWANAAHDIQTAVNAADPGDTVLVTNGVYATGAAVTPGGLLLNRVVVSKPVTLLSVNGPDATIIQGQGPMGDTAVRGVYLTKGALLRGFTVTDGSTLTNGDTYYDRAGGGVFLDKGGAISNCIVTASSADNAGGVYGHQGGSAFNSVIQGNQTPGYGGGIYCNGNLAEADVMSVVRDCLIVSNSASYAGGLGFYTNGLAVNCTIANNQATSDGGGIHLFCGGSIIRDCHIWSNSVTGGYGGGVCSANISSVFTPSVVTNCDVVGNTAGQYGGGVFFYWGTTGLVFNCQLIENSAGSGGGGAFNAQVFHTRFYRNHTPWWGGGAFGGTVYSSLFVNNTASAGGGAYGHQDYPCVLNNCTVTGNSATTYGGGAYLPQSLAW